MNRSIETRSLPALARYYLVALPSMSLLPVATLIPTSLNQLCDRHSENFDSFAPARLKLGGVPASSPLPSRLCLLCRSRPRGSIREQFACPPRRASSAGGRSTKTEGKMFGDWTEICQLFVTVTATTTLPSVHATKFEFEKRFWIICAIYFGGFLLSVFDHTPFIVALRHLIAPSIMRGNVDAERF